MKSMMIARWGSIINITSVIAFSGNPGQANYAAAKAGVTSMTRSLARELGSRNVMVNCVSPGLIDTDMTSGMKETQTEAILAQVPRGRLGSTADVANAEAFLAPGTAE